MPKQTANPTTKSNGNIGEKHRNEPFQENHSEAAGPAWAIYSHSGGPLVLWRTIYSHSDLGLPPSKEAKDLSLLLPSRDIIRIRWCSA